MNGMNHHLSSPPPPQTHPHHPPYPSISPIPAIHPPAGQILSGDTVVVKPEGTDSSSSGVGEERKLSLSSLRAPRQVNACVHWAFDLSSPSPLRVLLLIFKGH